jgi:hypothetical protein
MKQLNCVCGIFSLFLAGMLFPFSVGDTGALILVGMMFFGGIFLLTVGRKSRRHY